MSKLRAIQDHIIFQFEDESIFVNGKRVFREKHGVLLLPPNKEKSFKSPRWVTVRGVGPLVDLDIKFGSRILIEPLKWTKGVRFEGQEYWKTLPAYVIMIDEPDL